jgi:crotonobetainyl-CoA:carnitine CoA-transferase CaiB-like acyl-CoA transferase
VNFAEDLPDSPQVIENRMMVDLDHELSGPEQQVAPILEFRNAPLEAQGSSPPLGRDTDAIVAGAGYGAKEIAELRERGVIG